MQGLTQEAWGPLKLRIFDKRGPYKIDFIEFKQRI